ncbi:EAL domain-containing protein [Paraburkholderia sp. J67]|uniref:EAL domain-containing protein n=1 Tax=Paraburkholderia sp. J67 TaxID=2805435 RepID=UPI002ABD43BD|nr:EAL domain-containing protein [Paraburkholderia sp. J67]
MIDGQWRGRMNDSQSRTVPIALDLPPRDERAECEPLKLTYQPIVCARSGATKGAEAIAQWHAGHDAPSGTANNAPPTQQSGFTAHEFEQILDKGCAELSRWRLCTPGPVALSIDISLEHILGGDLGAIATRCIRRHAIRAENLKFEITEPRHQDMTPTLIGRLADLRRLGIAIVLDDFGITPSSLSSLITLPVSGLKFGRRFTKDLPGNETSAAIVASVVNLARDFGISVSIDGVETDDQLSWLRRFDNLDVQGTLISTPLSAESLFYRLLRTPDGQVFTPAA